MSRVIMNAATGEITVDKSWKSDAPAPAFTVGDVKAEAGRRILEFCPEWKQRNLTAQAAILAEKGRANWTREERGAWASGEKTWAHIAAIRAASEKLEAMKTIPNPTEWDGWP